MTKKEKEWLKNKFNWKKPKEAGIKIVNKDELAKRMKRKE